MLSQSTSKVNFFSEGVKSNIKGKKALKTFIQLIFKLEKRDLESINYIFCTDKMLREINKEYLNHDNFTDIITFHLSEPRKPIVSEVYVSIDRIKESAKDNDVTYKSELHRVIFHGALHLCGYSDKNRSDKMIMRKKEDFYLLKYFR
ncbi:MAG: rRNA maturation RNase YbeY [Pedobacter agri]